MHRILSILLGLAFVGFGPHPKDIGHLFPETHFTAGSPIGKCQIRQGDRVVHSFGGEASLCDGATCRVADNPSAPISHLLAELGPVEYAVPFTAWRPLYESGVIEAKVPVTFSSAGKPAGARPNGAKKPTGRVEVGGQISRYGIIPFGHLDDRVENVVLEGLKEGIARWVEDGDRQIEARKPASR
jgi:hypothetical protein